MSKIRNTFKAAGYCWCTGRRGVRSLERGRYGDETWLVNIDGDFYCIRTETLGLLPSNSR